MSSSAGDTGMMQPWEPARVLRRVSAEQVRYSRGFLRCRPERWCPGFAGQWLPLTHSLGVEVKVIEVRSQLALPAGLETGFVGSVDGESMSLLVDDESARTLLETLIPGAEPLAGRELLEYLAIRFLGSLARSWSGPESSIVRFESEQDPLTVPVTGAIRIGVMLNGNPVQVWLGLGRQAVERLDGLWRRQIRSSARQEEARISLALEIGVLDVPPAKLREAVNAGEPLSLTGSAGDQVTVRSPDRGAFLARLCDCDDRLALEVLPGGVPPVGAAARMSVEFGTITLDVGSFSELTQPGAMLGTDLPLSSQVTLRASGQSVGVGRLCSFGGRMAVQIERLG